MVRGYEPVKAPLFDEVLAFLLSGFLSSPFKVEVYVFFLVGRVRDDARVPYSDRITVPTPSAPDPVPEVEVPSEVVLVARTMVEG